jgi:TolA-binding protein
MRYGIDDAIKLMRTLPVEENENLVVRVMKTTLESLKVRIGDIVDDALKRQDVLGKKVADYRAQITSFEREIEARRHEINRLEEELNEVTRVKERLVAADNLSVTPNPTFGGGASHAPHAHPAYKSGAAPPVPPPRKPEAPKRPGSMPPKNELPPVIVAPQSEPELIPASEKAPDPKTDDKKKNVYKDDD